MNYLYQKDKDLIFIRRALNNREFEEYPLIVQPRTVLALDPNNNLVCYPIDSLAATSAISSSFSTTASYAMNGSSVSASFALTASYAMNGGSSMNINDDGGSASSVYLFNQTLNSGNA